MTSEHTAEPPAHSSSGQSLADAVREATERLTEAGVPSPRVDAE
jgi:release factor glutamine methyltransferase